MDLIRIYISCLDALFAYCFQHERIGALAGKHLRCLAIDGEPVLHQEVLLEDVVGRIRDVEQKTVYFSYCFFARRLWLAMTAVCSASSSITSSGY